MSKRIATHLARSDAVLAGRMKNRTGGPHSQIDHILVRGAVRPLAGVVFPHSGSDHRPIRAELEIG